MVVAMDTRSQGKSTDTSLEPLTYRKFAEDVKALADTLKLRKKTFWVGVMEVIRVWNLL
jgi:pimeloyl-ACP methyl ester carboxylesterase